MRTKWPSVDRELMPTDTDLLMGGEIISLRAAQDLLSEYHIDEIQRLIQNGVFNVEMARALRPYIKGRILNGSLAHDRSEGGG